MRKNGNDLSISQTKFIKYINENLNKSNSIIFYKNDGHFGLEYSISASFEKAKVLSLKELKSKTGKNLPFRMLNIVAAIFSFILNERKDVDARTTISTILSNMENIYLGIDKEKEYLKYLNIKKIPRQNRKNRFFIRVEESDINSEEDVHCLRLLCKLIEAGNINNTILLISGEKNKLLNLGIKNQIENIPLFEFDNNDLNIIARQNNIEVTNAICDNIDLIKKFGLQFFIDNYNYFDALAEIKEKNFDWIQKMDWIIEQIMKRSEITNTRIYPLLEFASFFEKYFSKIEIQNFENNQLDAENLNIAQKLEIINKEKSSDYVIPTYSFKLQAFKIYFADKYFSDLIPMPKFIFEYFRTNYPFEYIPALKVLKADSSFVDYKQKQSLIVIGYYYYNNEKGIVDYKYFLSLAYKDSTAATIISLYEYFKNKHQDDEFDLDIENVIKGLKGDSLDVVAACASYVMLLQFLKENYIQVPFVNFSSVMNDFMSAILEIKDTDNYNKYWQSHFKCQYIALSLEDENAKNRSARRFLDDVKKLREEENFLQFISDNHLRGFTRIDLLAFSLAYDDAGKILKELYASSEESTIIKELARINYSAYLIENENFHDAEKILKKGNEFFLENINIDTYCAYLNNFYLAQYGNNMISLSDYISVLTELVHNDISYSDKLIIENNLSVAYLIDETYANKGIEKLMEILEKGNPYNRFYAIHNLLSFYFTKNDEEKFGDVYKQIFIPKLLLSDKTFFLNKFKWLKENLGNATFEEFKHNPNVTACYNQLYLMSSIERWFE